MNVLNDNLKIGVGAINIAIQKAFSKHGVVVDDISWNPLRGGLVNHRFSTHSVQVTVGEWQEFIYRIEARDIVDYSFGVKAGNISSRIADLADNYQQYQLASKPIRCQAV